MSEELSKTGLSRSLKVRDCLALGFGAIVGWGWIAVVGNAMAEAGSIGALIAFIIAGVVITAIGLIYGELASAMPEVGGEHAYSLRALGRHASFICTWAIAFSYVAVVGLQAVALPDILSELLPVLDQQPLYQVQGFQVYLPQVALGMMATLVLAWLNIRGIKLAAFIQTIILMFVIAGGLAVFSGAVVHGDSANLQPHTLGAWGGIAGIFGAVAMVPLMMVGFDVIPQAAEEIDLPPKQIGKMIIWSLLAALFWYMLIVLGIGLLVPADARPAGSLATLLAAEAGWGQAGGTILMLAGVAGILTSWNSFLIGGARALFAMAQHNMLPKWFARLDASYHTPKNAILFISVLAFFAPLFGRPAVVWFVNAGSFGLMISFLFVCCSYIALRKNEPEMLRPYRAPFGQGLGWFGVISSGAITALFVIPGQPAALAAHEWLMVAIWFVGGWLAYRIADKG